MLELSRIDAERLVIEQTGFRPQNVIANVESLLGADLAAKGLSDTSRWKRASPGAR